MMKKNSGLLRFFKYLLEFRKAHPSLRSNLTADGESEYPVIWHGVRPDHPDWTGASHSVIMQITETAPGEAVPTEIYLAFNAYSESLTIELPTPPVGQKWRRIVDTNLDSPEDICLEESASPVADQGTYRMGAHSVVVLVGR